jgi:hypothetical protein
MIVLSEFNDVNELFKDSAYEIIAHTVNTGNQMTIRKVPCYLPMELAQKSNMPFYGKIILEEWHTQSSGDWCPRDNIKLKETDESIPTPVSLVFSRDSGSMPFSPLRKSQYEKKASAINC